MPSGPINWGVLILQVGITAGLSSVLTLAGQLWLKRVDYRNSLRQKLWETQLPRLMKLKDTVGHLAEHLPAYNVSNRVDELWLYYRELDTLRGQLAEYEWLTFRILRFQGAAASILDSKGRYASVEERRTELAAMRSEYQTLLRMVDDLLQRNGRATRRQTKRYQEMRRYVTEAASQGRDVWSIRLSETTRIYQLLHRLSQLIPRRKTQKSQKTSWGNEHGAEE